MMYLRTTLVHTHYYTSNVRALVYENTIARCMHSLKKYLLINTYKGTLIKILKHL